MKRTPLRRKTPMKLIRGPAAKLPQANPGHRVMPWRSIAARAAKPLRQKRSTGTPTKAQIRRWNELRAHGCVACHINNVDKGLARASYSQELEIHHLLSGGRRRGHDDTVCLCHYHHQGKRLPYADAGYREHAKAFGPCLEREPRRFREFYGSDDELLSYQQLILDGGERFGE